MRHHWKAISLFTAALFWPMAAQAFEYPLQFSPVGDYKNLAVAGYAIIGKTVTGNCSYTAVRSGSGRDPRTTYTPMPGACTWDLYGALVKYTGGTAPSAPAPVATQGTRTIYGRKNKNNYTGTDSALSGGGFVETYGAHYDWLTSNAYQVLPPGPHSFTITLSSNGDIALNVKSLKVLTALSGTSVTVNGSTCSGLVAAGGTCDVALTYDFSKLTSPTGLAYDGITVHLTSNAGVTNDFAQRYTLEVPLPVDDGGN